MGDTATALREFRDVAAKLEKAGQARRRARAAAAGLRSRQVRRRRSAAGCSAAYLGLESRSWRAGGERRRRAEAGCGRPREGRARPTRRSTCSARSPEPIPPTSRCAPAWRWRMSARGDLDKARSYLSAETAGSNPALWITLAEMELRGNRLPEGKAAVVQALSLDREPGAGGGRPRLPAGGRQSRSRLSADRCGGRCRAGAKATTPRRPSRCTSSRRASARTSSR